MPLLRANPFQECLPTRRKMVCVLQSGGGGGMRTLGVSLRSSACGAPGSLLTSFCTVPIFVGTKHFIFNFGIYFYYYCGSVVGTGRPCLHQRGGWLWRFYPFKVAPCIIRTLINLPQTGGCWELMKLCKRRLAWIHLPWKSISWINYILVRLHCCSCCLLYSLWSSLGGG